MNWKTLPDCPERLKHWSGHDPAAEPPAVEEDDPRIDCACGHKGFKEEVSLVDGRTVCVNCFLNETPPTQVLNARGDR